MKRKIITIDEKKCDGCGLCVPECKEGAIKIIDGKAKLVEDFFCDGLGACLGYCPQNAISIEEKETVPYSESKVLEVLLKESPADILGHLEHLIEHNEKGYLEEAVKFLKEKNFPLPVLNIQQHSNHHNGEGCPGSRVIDRKSEATPVAVAESSAQLQSELKQWPIQLHLVRPDAPYFKNSELVIMSTCGPLASPEVHPKYLRGRSVVVACPKLDRTEPYLEKLTDIFRIGQTPKAIVVIMQVPCCRGLSSMTQQAAEASGNENLVVEEHILTLEGNLLQKNIIYGNNIRKEIVE
jgi:ferredoxin